VLVSYRLRDENVSAAFAAECGEAKGEHWQKERFKQLVNMAKARRECVDPGRESYLAEKHRIERDQEKRALEREQSWRELEARQTNVGGGGGGGPVCSSYRGGGGPDCSRYTFESATGNFDYLWMERQ